MYILHFSAHLDTLWFMAEVIAWNLQTKHDFFLNPFIYTHTEAKSHPSNSKIHLSIRENRIKKVWVENEELSRLSKCLLIEKTGSLSVYVNGERLTTPPKCPTWAWPKKEG